MDDLNMEEFRSVLDQVIDYSLPESKKSPLVQKLNQQHAKEDLHSNCLDAVMFDKSQKQQTKFKNLNNKKSSSKATSNLIYEPTKNETSSAFNMSTSKESSHLKKLENFCESFDTNCSSGTTSLTNSLINNFTNSNDNWDKQGIQQLINNDNKLNETLASNIESSSLITTNTSESSQQLLNQVSSHHSLNHEPDNKQQCCDNCESSKLHQQRSKPLYVSNTSSDELAFEMKDYSRRAKIVEYNSNASYLKYADLKDNETNCDETKLVKPFQTETNYSNSFESTSYYDHSINSGNLLKLDTVNTQFASKRCLEESDANRNFSTDCLNRCK